MKAVALSAFPRTLARRPGAKRLRAQGRVPAVIYGRQAKPQNLEVDRKDLENLIHHSITENLLVDLVVDKDPRPKRLALVQEVQHHALSGQVLHVDLHEVLDNEKVTVMVPVETVGEATGGLAYCLDGHHDGNFFIIEDFVEVDVKHLAAEGVMLDFLNESKALGSRVFVDHEV